MITAIMHVGLSYRASTRKRWTDFNSSLLSSLTCNCNEHSQRCESVDKLGTVCVDCRHNTIGRNCDRCKHEFYWDRSKLFSRTDACTGNMLLYSAVNLNLYGSLCLISFKCYPVLLLSANICYIFKHLSS